MVDFSFSKLPTFSDNKLRRLATTSNPVIFSAVISWALNLPAKVPLPKLSKIIAGVVEAVLGVEVELVAAA